MTTSASTDNLPEGARESVLGEIDKAREKVIERITNARKLTDSEVYQAGVALNEVVSTAQAYMKQVNESMTNTAKSDGGVDDTLTAIRQLAGRQETLVAEALENLTGIDKAGRKIQEMSGASRLLALNARVESARLEGAQSRAFDVIADEMRELSQSVENTNTMVSELTSQLQSSLPKIQEQVRIMSETIASLVKEMDERTAQLQGVFQMSIDSGNEALDQVLTAARSGLSHLQFQDLMIQDLEGIERIMRRSRAQIASVIDPDATSDITGTDDSAFLGTIGAELDEEEESSDLDAGEVLLF